MADSPNDIIKSPIIMKVDSPVEDKEKSEPEEETPNTNDDLGINAQICSPSTTRPPLIVATNSFSNSFSNITSNKSLLRPSALGLSMLQLKPSKLNQCINNASGEADDTTTSTSKLSNKNGNTNGDAPKFVPLLLSENTNELIKPVTNIVPAKVTHSFVFGQNLQERVLSDGKDEPKPSTSVAASTNGATENDDMLFSSAVKESTALNNNSNKSLSESAREYEEQRATKRKYEEVEVKTGEEDETNVIHLSCKLFAFDKAVGNWQERGRGNLRLNDQNVNEGGDVSYKQSRLVFRTAGVLKVVLNTKIWADMTIEQASPKSIRFTAIDNQSGEVKVFLVMANPEEIKLLYKHLQVRLTNEQKRQNVKKASSTSHDGGDDENNVDGDL